MFKRFWNWLFKKKDPFKDLPKWKPRPIDMEFVCYRDGHCDCHPIVEDKKV